MTPSGPVVAGATATRSTAGLSAEPVRRRPLLLVALGLLAAVVVLELAAGPVVRPSLGPQHDAEVLAIPGVSGLIHNAPVDPAEVAQLAASRQRPSPLALPAQALLDGLLLVCVSALALPRLLPGRDVTRRARLGSFIASLVLLLAAIAAVVTSVARLRHLVALYLSPPLGTLSYLLLYDSFPRRGALVAVSALMALKVGACVALFQSDPTVASDRGIAGLAITSVAATVLTAFCYALASTSLASITDTLAAAGVAMVGVLWAGVIVSGLVRRLT